ncbi:DUF4105 domain-containing protein [Methylicorpusculum oleiharenae]|uniref:Lnb N-terminal periplasmic domain-containing protein n=1 Tax=Methylicorpusculum oleiharenae TaxID=1338687 RepID=UPI00135C28A1|nr:DUF4105 domain-containing protein [Methylicorpusculum oleiharenae]MCD2449413.1 DUF4105 domain-containing protein [Methylicorpusculum oleiharenae]
MFHYLNPLVLSAAICLLFCAGSQAYAETNTPPSLKQLAESPEWLALIHYQRKPLSGQWQSYVDDPGFFLAPDGKHNPAAELSATLSALTGPAQQGDQHASCRFPARMQWLSKILPQEAHDFAKTTCPNFEKWRKEMNSESISLIFASAYLNSPSSMFGHTLMRLDPPDNQIDTDWLAYALNFGALVDENDNSLFYAFKGLAGGYTGLFQLMPFYQKIKEYSFMENRDLWEYHLNLTPDETLRLLNHLWELQDIEFDYFYISENCSFRLLELLEVARTGSQLTGSFSFTAIPSEIVQAIHDRGFIQSVHYRPSQTGKLKSLLKAIPQQYQTLVEQLSHDIAVADNPSFTQAPISLQKLMVSAAYQLMSQRAIGKERTAESAKRRYSMLNLLNRYPQEIQTEPEIAVPSAPQTGHNSQRLILGGGIDNGKAYAELGYRLNYHDLLDNPDGYFKGAAINFFDLTARAFEDNRYRLQKLELLSITSLSPRDLFFQPISWRVATGLAYQNYGEDELSGYLNGGAGLSYAWLDNSLSYGFINAHLEHNEHFDHPLQPGTGISLGQLYYSKWGTSQLEFDSKIFIDGSYLYHAGLEHNFVLSQNQGLRFSVKHCWNNHDDFNQAQFSYRLYF